MLLALNSIDYGVMALYGAAVLSIGWLVNRRQKDSEDYFLGGRRLPWWAVGVSLIATSFSSVSLIGGTGSGYSSGMGWLQLQIGDLVALALVAAIFIPFFSGLGLTTAYEYLEKRFGGATRTLASSLFLGQTMLRAAVLVYGPALALAAVFHWPVEACILVAAGAAIVYSVFGGIGAVVWTDMIQLAVIVVAVTVSISVLAGEVPGGFGAILDRAAADGKLGVVETDFDPGTPMNLVGAVVPYMVLAFSLFGTGQQAVQRFLSVKSVRDARKVAITGWVLGTFALGISLFLGVCLSSWQALAPAAKDFVVAKGDQILPAFVADRLSGGLGGLMLAAIFAASMSSMDSAIHSMSTAWIVDFRRRGRRPPLTPEAELRTARRATAVIGVLAIGGALYAAEAETQILETLVTWLGYFAGPLLGLFLLGLASTHANQFGAISGTCLTFGAVIFLVSPNWLPGGTPLWASVWQDWPANFAPPTTAHWETWGPGVHRLWLAPLSFTVTYLAGLALSLVTGGPDRTKLPVLTLFTRSTRGSA